MADPLQATPPPFATEPAVDRRMPIDNLRPSPDVQGTSLEGETVLLDLSTGRYYTLNRLGSVIWEHCTRPATRSATFMRYCAIALMSPPIKPWTILFSWSTTWFRRGYFNRKRR